MKPLRPAPGQIPTDPGVYRFRDGDGRVIYVGKAKNLRSRLTSYFQDPSGLHQRTRTMVASARSVDWVVVSTEVEALSLEYAWIKEYDPRFNVRYRDDKSYPYLAVTVFEEFPRAMVMRGEKRAGFWYPPGAAKNFVCSSASSFDCLQAIWQLRQPMQRVVSTRQAERMFDPVFTKADVNVPRWLWPAPRSLEG